MIPQQVKQSACSVPRVTSSASGPISRWSRAAISSAALLVKVTAQMRPGVEPVPGDEPGDPGDQAVGLAGARAGHDQDGAKRGLDGLTLCGRRIQSQADTRIWVEMCWKIAVKPDRRQSAGGISPSSVARQASSVSAGARQLVPVQA